MMQQNASIGDPVSATPAVPYEKLEEVFDTYSDEKEALVSF